jgi:hypothetical protein
LSDDEELGPKITPLPEKAGMSAESLQVRVNRIAIGHLDILICAAIGMGVRRFGGVMHRILSFFILLFLAGCSAKHLEVSEVTAVKPTNGAAGLDVYEKRRKAGEQVPDFAGDQLVTIRTFTEKEGGFQGEEFPGAKCKLEARDFSAEVTSPAKVRVPIYRAQSSPLSVVCEHPEYKKKTVERNVFNKTKNERLSMGSSAGLAGVLIMAVVNEASDTTNDDFLYGDVHMLMTPLDPKKAKRKSVAVPGSD